MRTSTARPRAASASARRYWIVIQYRSGGSNRLRVRATSSIPLYHRYLEPVLGTVGGPCVYLLADRSLSELSVLTPLVVGGDYTTIYFESPTSGTTYTLVQTLGLYFQTLKHTHYKCIGSNTSARLATPPAWRWPGKQYRKPPYELALS